MSQGGASARDLQHRFYHEECDPEFEIQRPHNCGRLYRFLIEYKLQSALDLLDLPLADNSLLEVCAGSGLMTEKFSRQGARVTASDLSLAAVQRTRQRAQRYQFRATMLAADAEQLPFVDRSFDLVAVHDGLHHLDRPEVALDEMARVARRALIVMEPAAAALTTLAVKLGLAVNVEEAGNEVRRLCAPKIAELLRARGFERVAWRRSLMYYPHQPFGWFRWFEGDATFASLCASFHLCNRLLGGVGNKLALVARRA